MPTHHSQADRELVLGFRFKVQFFATGGGADAIDARFSRVSGLSATVETLTVKEGGQNLYSQQLPLRVNRSNLTLERGLVVGSPIGRDVEAAIGRFKFKPGNVMVSLLGETGKTTMAWLFLRAWPVRWALADLDASDEKVLIDTIELAYTHMQPVRA